MNKLMRDLNIKYWILKNRKEVQEQELKRGKKQDRDQERKIKRIKLFFLQKLKHWS